MTRPRQLDWRITVCESGTSVTARLIGLVLDTFMDGQGFAWPSRATIAARARVDVSTVDRALRQLEAAGLLTVSRSRGRRSNRYLAVFPDSCTGAAVGEAQQPHVCGPDGGDGAAVNGGTAVPPEAAIEKSPSKPRAEEVAPRTNNSGYVPDLWKYTGVLLRNAGGRGHQAVYDPAR